MRLEDRWGKTWEHLEMAAPGGLGAELLAAYAEDHRAYHTAQHLTECFAYLDRCGIEPEARGAFEIALWFHDAIYDTKAQDNEAKSADWAVSCVGALDSATLDRIRTLILMTQHDGVPKSPDEKLLVDIDLSILGASTERFREYEVQVRQEYSWVPEAAFKQGRAKILAEFQQRSSIYNTSYFQGHLEATARDNLARSLGALS